MLCGESIAEFVAQWSSSYHADWTEILLMLYAISGLLLRSAFKSIQDSYGFGKLFLIVRRS